MRRFFSALLTVALLCAAAWAEGMTALPNPWQETTADGLMQTLGVRFGVPEGAEEIVYRALEAESLAEMQFILQGAEYTARIMPADGFLDISGHFGPLELIRELEIGWCGGRIMGADADGESIRVCLWYDAAPGLMYSLSSVEPVNAQADIRAIAEEVYIPVQGDVE